MKGWRGLDWFWLLAAIGLFLLVVGGLVAAIVLLAPG